ncbi:MAG: hypothetical protein KKH28_11265, partial [Elusimicrobia bacterium]|nr:hypothetical protein [Elusimicrobiota bacterium]
DHQPATKGDIAAVKGDLAAVKTELKAGIAAVKDDLDNKFKDLSGEILKFHFKMDRMENRLNTEFSTKTDRIFNLLDSIAGDVKRYQREDALRGEAVMQHTEKLSNHETRITLLETKK